MNGDMIPDHMDDIPTGDNNEFSFGDPMNQNDSKVGLLEAMNMTS